MNAEEIMRALADPFAPQEVKWKPQVVSGERAMACCYIDARAVMDRLDEAVGPGGWQDAYAVLANGNVTCVLRVKVGGEWVQKEDVGGPSEQPDDGDKMKAAFSDALKRAAVKFGVGRYLYRLPHQWVDYDPKKRQFTRTPKLPPWALPGGNAAAPGGGSPTGPATAAPQSPAKISAGEKAELNKLLAAAGSKGEDAFFKVYAIDSLDDLTPDKFSDAVLRLNKYIEARRAKAG